jgi:hypothetical protein
MIGTSLFRVFVLCMSAAATMAAPAMTEIQDVLYKANGTLFEGVAQISWSAFVASDGTPVPANTVNIRVVRGQLRVSLVPVTDITNATVYTVRFNSEGKTQFVEYWAVPPAQTALKLKDIRVPGGTAGNLTSAVAIQDVSGLRTELDIRPMRGGMWSANRAAVIGSSGAIEAVSGSDSDCVRVDGTSAPCGANVVFVDGETPLGQADGTNRQFTLAAVPNPAASLRLFRNGILTSSSSYTLNGGTLVFNSDRVPAAGDIIQAWYRTSGATPGIVEGEVPAGTLDGSNLVFTLTYSPVPAASLQVFRNGVMQKQGIDYYVTANKVTFLPGSVPHPGDLLQVCYRK